MKELLSDLEGLRIAIEIERRGFIFYQKAWNKLKNQQAKMLFKTLMGEEENHLRIFTDFFAQIEVRKEAHFAEYLYDEEASRYLTVLVESHVFPAEKDAERIIDELSTVENIVKLALGAEKDSILLYDEMAKASKFEDAKAIFLKLKAEEQRHVIEISTKFKQILAE
jgi:rubrerythrin